IRGSSRRSTGTRRRPPGGGTGASGGGLGRAGSRRGRTLCSETGMKVLLTNDDGIQATGLNAMRRALLEVPGVELAVIAPDSNRRATARSITTRDPPRGEEVEFGDGTVRSATDG